MIQEFKEEINEQKISLVDSNIFWNKLFTSTKINWELISESLSVIQDTIISVFLTLILIYLI